MFNIMCMTTIYLICLVKPFFVNIYLTLSPCLWINRRREKLLTNLVRSTIFMLAFFRTKNGRGKRFRDCVGAGLWAFSADPGGDGTSSDISSTNACSNQSIQVSSCNWFILTTTPCLDYVCPLLLRSAGISWIHIEESVCLSVRLSNRVLNWHCLLSKVLWLSPACPLWQFFL